MMIENKEKRLWKLFLTVLYISSTTNGGLAMVGVMKDRFVDRYGWLDEEEMMDYTSIAQSVPGPIAVNASVLVGSRIAGLPGAAAAVTAMVLPPLVIMTLVTFFYEAVSVNPAVGFFLRGMGAAVCGLLCSITVDLFRSLSARKNLFGELIAAAAFLASLFLPVSKFFIAVICAAAGLAKALILHRMERSRDHASAS